MKRSYIPEDSSSNEKPQEPEDHSSNEKPKEPERKKEKPHRMKKFRAIKLQNENDGKVEPSTDPLFLRGKKRLPSKHKEKCNDLLKQCIEILNISDTTREKTTTFQGSLPVDIKIDLPTHQYHDVSFYSEETRRYYSNNKTEVKKIKALADRENSLDLEKIRRYEDTEFLSPISNILCESLEKKKRFLGLLDKYLKESHEKSQEKDTNNNSKCTETEVSLNIKMN